MNEEEFIEARRRIKERNKLEYKYAKENEIQGLVREKESEGRGEGGEREREGSGLAMVG